jgi:hypothetical protein
MEDEFATSVTVGERLNLSEIGSLEGDTLQRQAKSS